MRPSFSLSRSSEPFTDADVAHAEAFKLRTDKEVAIKDGALPSLSLSYLDGDDGD